MKSAQFSRPVKWPFHKSDISKQSTGTFPLQFSANLRQPGFMKSAFHGVPAQVGRHKAPKCEREHHQRTLFCLARALPSQSMYIIAAMDRRGPPPLRKIVIGSAEQSRCVVHRVGRCELLHRRQGGPRLRASDRTGAQITQRSTEMRTTIQISSANDRIAVDAFRWCT